MIVGSVCLTSSDPVESGVFEFEESSSSSFPQLENMFQFHQPLPFPFSFSFSFWGTVRLLGVGVGWDSSTLFPLLPLFPLFPLFLSLYSRYSQYQIHFFPPLVTLNSLSFCQQKDALLITYSRFPLLLLHHSYFIIYHITGKCSTFEQRCWFYHFQFSFIEESIV